MSLKVIISFDVADTENFKKAFSERDGARREVGISAESYFQIDAPNTAVMLKDSVAAAMSYSTEISHVAACRVQELETCRTQLRRYHRWI